RVKWRKMFYGVLSFGWNGSTKHWQRHEALSLVLAGLSTPLVLSVHTIVSFDFATSVVPGWHTTIFPPYFVAGAIFSGFAMVQSLLVITRKVLKLEEYITIEHIDVMNKIIVLTGSIVGCAYLTELFIAWYGQNKFEGWAFLQNRVNLFSPYGWSYYIMMGCNVLSPQIFWFRKLRRNLTVTFFMSVIVNIGMWFERFVIIVTSLYRDYIPSSWSTYYTPSIWEIGFFLGTFGLFFTCYFLFSKFFPVIAVAEIKNILKRSGENFKEKMGEAEKETPEEFAHEFAHAH
ncbi:MAG TPA: NrfD/PsrC family molybdoenzyme membrane anchor subunit, partial [Puia sp.]|nr:NrfD/PsrC family molybdoenzyme membrane anchor subunit [Puia sp.]